MKMTKKLSGILAAVSTPFGADGQVDEGRLRDHVDFLIDNGLHGLVPCGSTGEFAALTVEERKRVNEIVIAQAAGRVPVAPQTGSTRTAEAVELSQHAAAAGADAVLVVQPFYEAPTRREVIEYFATVGEAAGIPVIAYNLPGVTGMNLDRPFYRELLERTDAVKYIKDTSGSIEQAFDLIFNLGDAIDTFVGWDTIVLPAFSAGAAGSIWGAPNFAPKECVAIYELAEDGRQLKRSKSSSGCGTSSTSWARRATRCRRRPPRRRSAWTWASRVPHTGNWSPRSSTSCAS